MSKRNQLEIIPPSAGMTARPDNRADMWGVIPQDNSRGLFSSMRTRWRIERQGRTFEAMKTTMEHASEYFDARTEAIESSVKAWEAEHRLQQLPILAAEEAARQREERAEELRELQHRHDMAELRRATERAEAEAALYAAQSTLATERDLGPEIHRKKRGIEMLDFDLAVAERRAVLRQHLVELERAVGRPSAALRSLPESDLENALYEARAQLNANGLDTSTIDAVLERRAGR